MDLRIYRQKATTLKDGLTVYSGEDARPYVDEHLIMVADGLGGTGAIRHSSVDRGVLDKDTVVKTFFKGIYDNLDDEVFANYVTDSFVELYEAKEFFGKNVHAIKKSSYFGSRLLLSVLLYHFKNDADLSAEKLLGEIAVLSGEEKEKHLVELGEKIRNIIKEDLHKVAVNANIIYESSIQKLKLLATTMCVTVFQEKEDCVDALYFIAGDSRPYFWNEKEGLCQVSEDLEGEDGGMTSCVYEGGDFSVCCKHFRFSKPCILFNASDGCFDSGMFQSQMAFEKLILDAIVDNDSIENAENALVEKYDVYGTHDDSSTLALRTFGYNSFDELKSACNSRMAFLNERYLSKMDDLLTEDYVTKCQRLENDLKTTLSSVKERFTADPAVIEWCRNYIASGKYLPYSQAVESIDAKMADKNSIIKKAREKIIEAVARNYSRFIDYTEHKNGWFARRSIANIDGHWDKCENISNDYISELEEYRREFARAVDAIKEMIENIYEIGVPESFEDYDDLNFEIIGECEKTLDDLFEFFDSIKKKKVKIVKRLMEEHNEYIKRNVAMAQNQQENFRVICNMIFSNGIDLNEVKMLTFDKKAILTALQEIQEAKVSIEELNTKHKESALNDAIVEFMVKEYFSIIVMVLNDISVSIDPQLKAEATETIDNYNDKMKELKEKADTQAKLFENYDADYGRIMRGELYGH